MCKVFIDDEWEEMSLQGQIPHLGIYQPYRLPGGIINPEFRADRNSGRILDLKDKDERAINYFFNQIDNELEKDITICVVPSHTESDYNDSGIAILARRLAKAGRIDGVDFLLRGKSISKLSKGGSRDAAIQYDSITINPDMSIEGDVVLLIDDVTTTGTSLEVCRDILLKNGANRVAMFAIGKTV